MQMFNFMFRFVWFSLNFQSFLKINESFLTFQAKKSTYFYSVKRVLKLISDSNKLLGRERTFKFEFSSQKKTPLPTSLGEAI